VRLPSSLHFFRLLPPRSHFVSFLYFLVLRSLRRAFPRLVFCSQVLLFSRFKTGLFPFLPSCIWTFLFCFRCSGYVSGIGAKSVPEDQPPPVLFPVLCTPRLHPDFFIFSKEDLGINHEGQKDANFPPSPPMPGLLSPSIPRSLFRYCVKAFYLLSENSDTASPNFPAPTRL